MEEIKVKTNNMQVSIIIPVYNVELYIERCIDSVIAQTFQGDMECILVDDCCTDDSLFVAERIITDYSGPIVFRILKHKKNRGLAAARNTATEIATGEYLYYLDSDDTISKDCIDLMVKEVESHPGVEMVIGAYANSRNGESPQLCEHGLSPIFVDSNKKIRFEFFKEGDGFEGIAVNRLIKRSFVVENGIRFKEGIIHEDTHWSFYVYKRLKTLSVIEQCTYIRYIRHESIMTTTTEEVTAENLLKIIGDWVNEFDGFGKSLQMYKALELFLQAVFPHLSKSKTKSLHKRFLEELIRERQLYTAFVLLVNICFKWRYYQLSYVLVPKAYHDATLKLEKIIDEQICHI